MLLGTLKLRQAAGTLTQQDIEAINALLAKEALYEMGAICAALGKREDALRHFTRILEQDIGFRDVATKVAELKP